MAKFQRKLAESEDDLAGALLATTMLWLRTLDGDIGYENYLRLCVPFSNDLYFGANVPSVLRDWLPVSDGRVMAVVNCTDPILWSRNWRAELNLGYVQGVSDRAKVHMSWLEWALGTAIIKLWEAGIDWIPVPKAKTIGGLEVADLDL